MELPQIFSNDSRIKKDGAKVIYQGLDSRIWLGGHYSLSELIRTDSDFKINQVNINGNRSFMYKITTLYQTSDSIFWIGTQQHGLKKSIGIGNPTNQVFEDLLDDERISAFLEDSSGKIWVGTFRGLQVYQPTTNSFKSYNKTINKASSLSSDIIKCLFEDSKGNIWIGTPNGLNLIIENEDSSLTFKSFQVKDGLPNNYIHAILEDKDENLWISTDKGISQYNLSKNSFYNYDVNDGLQANSFMENSASKGTNGKLFFGSIYGLNNFYPDSIKKSSLSPAIITGLKVSGQEIHPNKKYNDRYIIKNAIEYTKEITLTNKENIFSIEYGALDLSSTSNAYQFKMEGLDKDWQTTTSQKNVTYSNLKAGDYEFKVKTIHGESNSEASVTSLKIKILPPLWQTWQAFVLYTLIFIGLLYLYRYFIKRQHDLKTKLELAKLNRKKEKKLAEMKTRFFTNIAHEIRTPLSLISGPIETLLQGNLSKIQQKDYLTTADYHSKRLLNLVSQLLDFRKIESGKMTLRVAKGNFAKFTREIFLSFKELAKSKNIQFDLDLKNTEIPLTYDREKMEIVLCNLLSNAFKYANSKIKISLAIKEAKQKKTSEFTVKYCEISVLDDGKGMPRKVIDKIFDRFYQIANTESINLIGTGIGLALVKSIVELHHGNVRVKSRLGKGSTFIVNIPLGDTHFEKSQFIPNYKKSEDPIHYQVERVLSEPKVDIDSKDKENESLPTLLIIEDNVEIRTFIKSVFKENFKILEAENGILGFEMAMEYLPTIIICDLMMPKMDGLTLSTKLKSTKETLHIPIIMLTARTTAIFQEKGYNSGVDMYVTKPFNISVLKSQVKGLLSNRRKLKDFFNKNIILQPAESDVTSIDQEFLKKAMKLVEDNLTNEKLNRDFIASKMSVSSSTLYRKIKSITDLDITVFIRSIRLKKAAQMIKNNEDNISGVAYQVGFNDLKYFRKCFISQFGVTPSQFKKNHSSKT
ncbi:ATP-binding protein [Aureibaculum sp. 2210JD6-5]|uniref:hybrid sensor histidine kinase/response regulator n=1 Tax=Aureibaculum sp. 2210JD6-5 TaxID=3103957 RepID=UPI002AAE0C4D|nr:ATP-binding protein [Aureibaculum sp. 2210JD6-5]MDY7395802.1 ATP-binding protein [Aureibaculum sp. 2210JD6-5]